jgi:beta-lactamase class D
MKGFVAFFIAAALISGCSFNNVDRADYLQPYFDSAGVQGCFALYDNARNEFTIYNKERYLKRFPAGGTFNIVTGLIGLETGKVFDEMKPGFNGGGWTAYPPLSALGGLCATDTGRNLMDNFRENNVPYFQSLARTLGKDTIVNRIKALSYGNMDTLGPVDSLWLGARLTISADEQLGLIKELFFNQLPFQQRTQHVMQKVLEREKTTNYTLAWLEAYTGDSTGRPLAWVMGWVMERQHPYFFVLNYEGSNECGLPEKLMRKVLTQQGLFKGVK